MNNILLDCERTKYPNTGLFQFCLQLGRELIEQHDPEQESLFFYLPEKQLQLFGNNQQVVAQHHLHKFFQPGTGKFRVWHSTFQNSNYKPYNDGTRVVLTVNDLNFLIESKHDKDRIKKQLQHVQKNVDRADHLVCISAYTKQMVMENLSVGSKPIEVVYDGYDSNEFPDFDKPLYRPTKKFIFSIGTVLPKKNFHVLPALLKNNDYELVIAGIIDKTYGEKIIEAAKLHGVADRVTLTGPVSEESKYWYYTHCDAFAFPSLAEGFGLPVVEAMHYGKPVFISRLTSLPEIGGGLAYYFDDFDAAAMQQVFEKGMQHYHATNPAASIQQRAQQFNWVNTAKSYLRIYRTLYNK
ncbi:MAG: glycosyltransferase family 1 protein [Chitinophagaceae bacterium]